MNFHSYVIFVDNLKFFSNDIARLHQTNLYHLVTLSKCTRWHIQT